MAADSIRYIRDLLARQTPTLPSWPICTSMDLMLIITPLETNARTLIPTRPAASVGTGWNETAGKTTTFTFTRGLLRNQRLSAKYADIFEKETAILSWTWRIYATQYVKVDIRTNKPLNAHFRFRLSFSVSLMDWQQTRFNDTNNYYDILMYLGLDIQIDFIILSYKPKSMHYEWI